MKKIIRYGSLLILAFFIFSFANFFILVRPFRLEIPTRPEDVDLDFEEVSLTTEDNKELSALYFDSDSESAIILLHGYPSNKKDLLHTATNFTPHFSVLLFDFRYFGESEGHFTTLGAKEIFDVAAAVDFLKDEGYERIGLFGYSLGGATALRAAAVDDRIDAVVTLGAFADMKLLADEFYSYMGPFRNSLFVLMDGWSRIFFGQSVNTLSPAKSIDQVEAPMLLGHAVEDRVVSFEHAEILSEIISEEDRNDFYFFEEGGHEMIPTSFIQRATIFFQNNL